MVSTQSLRQFNIYKFVLTIPGILVVYSAMFTVFFLLRLVGGNDPIALKIGGLTFRWYGILITIGVVLALYLTQYLAERRGEDPNRAWALLPILLVTGILGARLWYVINTWEKYKDHIFSIGDPNIAGALEVWRGGIAIQGAVVGGIIGILIYSRFTSIKFLRWADFIVPGLILAQGLGRWGNFMNNEAYGRTTGLPWGIQIPCEYRTRGTTPGTNDTSCPVTSGNATFHPTFFYESVWNYAVFLTLYFMIMYPKKVQKALKIRLRDGDIFLAYLVFYSIGRFFVESLRTDSLFIIGNPVDGGIRSAQALSIVGIFIGSVWFIYRHRRSETRDDEALSVRVAPRTLVPAVATADAALVTDTEALDDNATEAVNEEVENNASEVNAEVEDETEAIVEEPSETIGEVRASVIEKSEGNSSEIETDAPKSES